VPTAIEFSATTPTEVRSIQGVARVPIGFGKVVDVTTAPGRVTFIDEADQRVEVAVDHEFLHAGR